jgi:hypothetical protein
MLITKARFCEERGIKETTLQGWIARHLTRGVHFVVHGRTTLVDPEAIEEWLINTQLESVPTEAVSRSASSTPAAPTRRRFQPTTPVQRLRLPQRFENGKT